MKKFRDFVNEITKKRRLPKEMGAKLEEFLDNHVKGEWTYDKERDEVNVIGKFECGNFDLDDILVDGKMPFKFGTVKKPAVPTPGTLSDDGNFSLSLSLKLRSLVGIPREVEEMLRLSHLTLIEKIEGCEKVGQLYINELGNLASLEGTPVVSDKVEIKYCQKLNDLEGIRPENVLESFVISGCKNLETLKGSPEKVNGHVSVMFCPKIKDFSDIPVGTIYSYLPKPNADWDAWSYKRDMQKQVRETIVEQEFDMNVIELWLKSGMPLKEFKEKKKTLIVSTKYGF